MLLEPIVSRGEGYTLKDQLTLRFFGLCYAKQGLACYGWSLSEGINGLNVFAADAGVASPRGSKYSSTGFACYVGLGKALRWLADQKWDGDFIIQTNHQPIIDYLENGVECGPELRAAHDKCKALLHTFGEWKLEYTERKHTEHAAAICSQAYMQAMKAGAA